MEVEELVARGYDRVADAYAGLEGAAEWPRLRRLRDLLHRLPAHSRVLDLGCGSGIPALREIVAGGHSAVGVDVSSEQIRRARANVPEAELIHASALDVDLPPGTFDAVVCFYAIDHLPRERHGDLLVSIHQWLRAGGWLLLTFETNDQPGVVGEWLGEPMFFSHYDPATSQELVRAAGFELVSAEEEPQLEGEREVPYLWVLARASAADVQARARPRANRPAAA
jgi:cyclopropane fatty-acyl-phospholipid synthase-like methyltransferase